MIEEILRALELGGRFSTLGVLFFLEVAVPARPLQRRRDVVPV